MVASRIVYPSCGQGHLQLRFGCALVFCRVALRCHVVPAWGPFRQHLGYALTLPCAVLQHHVVLTPASTFVTHRHVAKPIQSRAMPATFSLRTHPITNTLQSATAKHDTDEARRSISRIQVHRNL